MASLVKCRACGNLVAKHAKRCPYCGQTDPTPVSETLMLFLVPIGIFLAFELFGLIARII